MDRSYRIKKFEKDAPKGGEMYTADLLRAIYKWGDRLRSMQYDVFMKYLYDNGVNPWSGTEKEMQPILEELLDKFNEDYERLAREYYKY